MINLKHKLSKAITIRVLFVVTLAGFVLCCNICLARSNEDLTRIEFLKGECLAIYRDAMSLLFGPDCGDLVAVYHDGIVDSIKKQSGRADYMVAKFIFNIRYDIYRIKLAVLEDTVDAYNMRDVVKSIDSDIDKDIMWGDGVVSGATRAMAYVRCIYYRTVMEEYLFKKKYDIRWRVELSAINRRGSPGSLLDIVRSISTFVISPRVGQRPLLAKLNDVDRYFEIYWLSLRERVALAKLENYFTSDLFERFASEYKRNVFDLKLQLSSLGLDTRDRDILLDDVEDIRFFTIESDDTSLMCELISRKTGISLFTDVPSREWIISNGEILDFYSRVYLLDKES